VVPEERPTLVKDLRLYILLGVVAVVLLIFLADEHAGLEDTRARIRSFEDKVLKARDTIRFNRDVLLPPREKVLNPSLLAEKSLRTVVMEACEKVGISGNLEAVNPGEDRKKGILRARVVIRGVELRKIVGFIVHLKNCSAGIRDTDASLRMMGYNLDRWRLDITLEAPPGVRSRARGPGGNAKDNNAKDKTEKADGSTAE